LKSAVGLAVLFFSVSVISRALDGFNGFDVTGSLIPKDEIMSGGPPPRDGIPAILNPKFEKADEADWLGDGDLVTGINHNGVQKAYPLRILVWHEAANDDVGGAPVLVTYCPLCGSTVVYRRDSTGKTLTFGISGLLYQSNVLFYDHQTKSLWSQLDLKAVSGKLKGQKIGLFPSALATWGQWKQKHPGTLVLSRDTGYSRDYGRDPYRGYEKNRALMFPVRRTSDAYHPKEKILVVVAGGATKAYPFSELKKADTPLSDGVGGQEVTIHFNDGTYVSSTGPGGIPVKSFVTFWFAWYAFSPDTEVYKR